MASAQRRASSASATHPSDPGTTGTPAAFIMARAAALSPMARITSPEGPMKVRPHFWHRSAKSAFSDKKP